MDKNSRINKILNNLFLFSFALFLFYYSYRYIFKYNSTTTSPSYSDTPVSFQVAKYILIVLGCLFTLMLLIIKNHRIKINPLLLIYYLVLLYDFAITKSSIVIVSISILTVFIIIYFSNAIINIDKLKLLIDFFIIFSIIYEAIQIILFVFTGRLPALAYATGVISDVRFGGPWDDPNGFGIILSFLIPYVYLTKTGSKRNILVCILLCMLVLTWSFTAYFCFGVVFVIWLYTRYKNKMYFLGLCALTLVLLVLVLCTSHGRTLINNKIGSITDHFNSYNLENFSIANLLGITPQNKATESGYISLLYSGGILSIGLFAYISAIGIKGICKLLKNNQNTENIGIYKAMLLFCIIYLIGMFNLPLNSSFSVSGIYYMFILIGWLYNLKSKDLIKER